MNCSVEGYNFLAFNVNEAGGGLEFALTSPNNNPTDEVNCIISRALHTWFRHWNHVNFSGIDDRIILFLETLKWKGFSFQLIRGNRSLAINFDPLFATINADIYLQSIGEIFFSFNGSSCCYGSAVVNYLLDDKDSKEIDNLLSIKKVSDAFNNALQVC